MMSTIARDLINAGLLFVHPDMIEGPRALNAVELKMWMLCQAHRRAPLSLAELARRVGEPLDVTTIRAARIREMYVLPLANETEAA